MASSDTGSSENELEEYDGSQQHQSPCHQRLQELRDGDQQNGKRAASFKPVSNFVPPTESVRTDTTTSLAYKEPGEKDLSSCRGTIFKPNCCIDLAGGGTDFQSETTTKKDFTDFGVVTRAPMKIPTTEISIGGTGPLTSITSYSKDYTTKPIATVTAVRHPDHKAAPQPFEGLSTAKQDFVPHHGVRRPPPFLPRCTRLYSPTPVSRATTTSDAYPPYHVKPMEKPPWAVRKPYVQTKNEQGYHSSYQSDYMRPAPKERMRMIIPEVHPQDMMIGPAGYKGPTGSMYSDQFVAFSGRSPPKSFKEERVYQRPKQRFGGESVYKANYHGDTVPRVQPIVPQSNNIPKTDGSTGPGFATTYRETFKPDPTVKCDMTDITALPDEYDFVGIKGGHHYYVQKSPRRTKAPHEILPATPESLKTDRERSSPRPPSASGHSSRPAGQTGGANNRSTSVGNNNNSNSNASPRKRGVSAGKTRSESARKADVKPASRSGASNGHGVKASSKPSSVSKKPATKTRPRPASAPASTKSAVPPPIRPPKKDAAAVKPANKSTVTPSAKPVTSSSTTTASATTTTTTTAGVTTIAGGGTKSTAARVKSTPSSVARTTVSTTTPTTTVTTRPTAAAAKSTAVNAQTTTASMTTSVSSAAKATTAMTTTTAATPTTATSTVGVTTATTTTTSMTTTTTSSVMPTITTTSTTASALPSTQKAAVPPSTGATSAQHTSTMARKQPLVTDAKPVPRPVSMVSSTTPPMSTSAPAAPTTNSEPLLCDLAMSASTTPPVEPAIIKPMVAATAAAAPPARAPIRPPTLVAAPTAPVPAPVPALVPMGADLDLSLLDTAFNAAVAEAPPVEADGGFPKMPVIAPPPAPAQPIVRMGNGPREANLLN